MQIVIINWIQTCLSVSVVMSTSFAFSIVVVIAPHAPNTRLDLFIELLTVWIHDFAKTFTVQIGSSYTFLASFIAALNTKRVKLSKSDIHFSLLLFFRWCYYTLSIKQFIILETRSALTVWTAWGTKRVVLFTETLTQVITMIARKTLSGVFIKPHTSLLNLETVLSLRDWPIWAFFTLFSFQVVN